MAWQGVLGKGCLNDEVVWKKKCNAQPSASPGTAEWSPPHCRTDALLSLLQDPRGLSNQNASNKIYQRL